MKVLNLKIKGMMCNHCRSHVEKSFKEVDGVKDVEVILEKEKATIGFDESITSVETIKASLLETNYEIV